MLDTAGVRLQVGDPVPDFSYSSEAFGSVSAASLRGKRYVMYFYPKDDTPGCTREACAFRDNLPRFAGIGVKVFGVSADDEKSHLRFARKHALPFKLIPDPDHVICEAFGTWIEKNMYGRSYMGVARSTFVIGPDGKIEKIWDKVAPDGHAEEVFAWLNGDPIPVPAKPAPLVKPAVPPAKPAASPASAKTPAKPVTPSPAAAPKPAAPKAAVPEKPAVKPVPKPAPVKTAAKKAAPAKPAASKPAPAKPAKPVAKKAPGKKTAKPVAKKPAAKKTASKPAAKKPIARKPAAKPAAKKVVARKVVAKKPATKKAKPRR